MTSSKIGLIYSISGNAHAFKFALGELEKEGVSPDNVYSLGDIVGYARNTEECLEIASTIKNRIIGYWEYYAYSYLTGQSISHEIPSFALPLSEASDLNHKKLSDTFQKLYTKEEELSISEEALINVIEAGDEWEFVNWGDRWIIRKEDQRLQVYRKILLDFKDEELRLKAQNTLERLRKQIETPQFFSNYIHGPLKLNQSNLLINDFHLLKYGFSKLQFLLSPWDTKTPQDCPTSQKIILGLKSVPPILYTFGKMPERLPFEKDSFIEWTDSVCGVSIGSVGYSRYFLKGYMHFAILDENGIKVCARKYKFNPDDYDL